MVGLALSSVEEIPRAAPQGPGSLSSAAALLGCLWALPALSTEVFTGTWSV